MKSLNHGFDAASPQTRSSYGTEYVETLINGLKECGKTTHPTLLPVINSIEHAATSSRPQCRYLIQGSNKLIDCYCVSMHSKCVIESLRRKSSAERHMGTKSYPAGTQR